MQFQLIAKTLQGLEGILETELLQLGAANVVKGKRMVAFEGDKKLMYKANFCCRTAIRILKPIATFKAAHADEVYQHVKKIAWDEILSCKQTFAVESVVYSEDFTHSKFVAYKTKDAIADFFNEKYGQRPSVRINNPDIYVHIHISHNDCTVALDSSGESLHKRGYRVKQGEAPLNEVLAAGMILLTGWQGESNFVDPMCGSGTLLIEAALIALRIPPGIYRKKFAFEKWNDFEPKLLSEIDEDAQEEKFEFKCFGSDVSPIAVRCAKENVHSAGLDDYVKIETRSLQNFTNPPANGIIVTNPPYGERIKVNDIVNLYAMIGERLKHAFSGYQAWILSYKDECFNHIGLKPSKKIKLNNGAIECEYRCYQLFRGTNREFKTKSYEN